MHDWMNLGIKRGAFLRSRNVQPRVCPNTRGFTPIWGTKLLVLGQAAQHSVMRLGTRLRRSRGCAPQKPTGRPSPMKVHACRVDVPAERWICADQRVTWLHEYKAQNATMLRRPPRIWQKIPVSPAKNLTASRRDSSHASRHLRHQAFEPSAAGQQDFAKTTL